MITHSTAPFRGTPKKVAIAGRLMLTIEESSVAMKTPTPTIASTAHLLVVLSCCAVSGRDRKLPDSIGGSLGASDLLIVQVLSVEGDHVGEKARILRESFFNENE